MGIPAEDKTIVIHRVKNGWAVNGSLSAAMFSYGDGRGSPIPGYVAETPEALIGLVSVWAREQQSADNPPPGGRLVKSS